jgi:hypothetical protein
MAFQLSKTNKNPATWAGSEKLYGTRPNRLHRPTRHIPPVSLFYADDDDIHVVFDLYSHYSPTIPQKYDRTARLFCIGPGLMPAARHIPREIGDRAGCVKAFLPLRVPVPKFHAATAKCILPSQTAKPFALGSGPTWQTAKPPPRIGSGSRRQDLPKVRPASRRSRRCWPCDPKAAADSYP